MSFPVLVIVGETQEPQLSANAEAICERLGSLADLRLVWSLGFRAQADFGARLLIQQDAMLRAWRGSGEGGYAELILAGSTQELMQIVPLLPPAPTEIPRRMRLGILLAEELESPLEGFEAIHIIPQDLGGQRLNLNQRAQSAGNLLGAALELIRLPEAQERCQEWLRAFSGRRRSLIQVARFNAPAVQRILAARLAARLSQKIKASLEKGCPLSALELPQAPDFKRLQDRAQELGAQMAQRIYQGALKLEELKSRQVEALRELPAQVEVEIRALGQAAQRETEAWLEEMEAWTESGLRRGGFAALPPLQEELARRLEDLKRALKPHERRAPEERPLSLESVQIEPPPLGRLAEAQGAVQSLPLDDERSLELYGAWGLFLAALGGLLGQAPIQALHSSPQAAKLLSLLPGGGYSLLALSLLLLAFLILGARSLLRRRHERCLKERLSQAQEALKQAWIKALSQHFEALGTLIQQRLFHSLKEALEAEQRRVKSIVQQLKLLEQLFKGEAQLPQRPPQLFDRDVPMGSGFFEAATLEPGALFRDFEEGLKEPSWRAELEFMEIEAFSNRCLAAYADFAEHLPLEQRQDLCAQLRQPVSLSITEMREGLKPFFPPYATRLSSFLLLPPVFEVLRSEDPNEVLLSLPAQGDLFMGLSEDLEIPRGLRDAP